MTGWNLPSGFTGHDCGTYSACCSQYSWSAAYCWQETLEAAQEICDYNDDCLGVQKDNGGYCPRGDTTSGYREGWSGCDFISYMKNTETTTCA